MVSGPEIVSIGGTSVAFVGDSAVAGDVAIAVGSAVTAAVAIVVGSAVAGAVLTAAAYSAPLSVVPVYGTSGAKEIIPKIMRIIRINAMIVFCIVLSSNKQ